MMSKILAVVFLIVCTLGPIHAQMPDANGIIYVKSGGHGNGSSWGNATGDLQAAIDAPEVIEVWVAAGTYKPTTDQNREITFQMKNGVAIYGGFAGNETQRSDRNWVTNETILSGDIDNDDVNGIISGNNSYHVISNYETGVNSTAGLDGFTISGGNATGSAPHNIGGGMRIRGSSPTISNCIFRDNVASFGGGMFSIGGSPTLTNCSFIGNSADFTNTSAGGGMYISGSPTLYNCRFINNTAKSEGAGMTILGDESKLYNCSFLGNMVDFSGGAVYIRSARPMFYNCIFFRNSAQSGSAIYNDSDTDPLFLNCSISVNFGSFATYHRSATSKARYRNCIIWGNNGEIGGGFGFTPDAPMVSYSIVKDGYMGQGNLDVDPLFIDQYGDGDLRLKPCSPAIDAGSNTDFPPEVTTDLDGNDRFYNGSPVDMGAYENQGVVCCPAGNILYVNHAATGKNNGTSWANAFTDLQDALASTCSGINQIWVAKGTYSPSSDMDRTVSFAMRNGVAVYGGFSGTETQLTHRNWVTNTTNLSGDINHDGTSSGNSYHVISNLNLDTTAILDGFTITDGNATDAASEFFGGGIYNINSSPSFTNVVVLNNMAQFGAGMYNENSSPTLTNIVVSSNAADAGGGLYNNASAPVLINSTISGNAADAGGGFYNDASAPHILNTIVFGNGINNISNVNSSNPKFVHSLIENRNDTDNGNIDATGISVSDIFSDPFNGDFSLVECSPAVNAGDNLSFTGLTAQTKDLAGNSRVFDYNNGGLIDIGAYEYQAIPDLCILPGPGNILYVNKTVDQNLMGYTGDGSSWANAIPELADALRVARKRYNADNTWLDGDSLRIYVAEGTYRPLYSAANSAYHSDGGRDNAFVLCYNVQLYGGFPNSGNPGLMERDPDKYPTILNGINTSLGNIYHVVISAGEVGNALLDGFIITGGYANGFGGLNVNNISILNSQGGGINIYSSSPTLRNLIIEENIAIQAGGGLNNRHSSPNLINIIIRDNTTTSFFGTPGVGGGIANNNSSPVLTNVLLHGNSANGDGGGIFDQFSSSTLINVTISGNAGDAGAGIFHEGSSITNIFNSIIFGNGSKNINSSNSLKFYHSLVEGRSDTANGNFNATDISVTDIFSYPEGGDYTLNAGSPAFNAGLNNYFSDLDGTSLDLAGNPRLLGGIIDLGAYEFFTASGISITKSVTSMGEYEPGDEISYEIIVTNLGANALSDVVVVDTGATPVEMNSYQIGDLAVNETDTIAAYHKLTQSEYCDSISITNVAMATGMWNHTVFSDTATITIELPSVEANTIDEGEDRTVCAYEAIEDIVLATTGASGAEITGLPVGVTGTWANDAVTISGIPTVSGTYNYTVTLMGGCGLVSAMGTISVNPLKSLEGGKFRRTCVNEAIENIVLATTGATGAEVTGLPTGVTGTWADDKVTISGTPSQSGTFKYMVTLTGCGMTSTDGFILVDPLNTIEDGVDRTTCIQEAITDIVLSTTGATGAEVTGLPTGVSGTWTDNKVTISGTPSQSGIFDYTVLLTGGCGTVSTTGTITVNPLNTIQDGVDRTTCIQEAITDIVLSTTGATHANFNGLPEGLLGSLTDGNVIISGAPSVSGDFDYTVTLLGGCGMASTTGTITVIPQSDLAIEKTVDNSNPAPGTRVTFTLTARNVGGVNATQVYVVDLLPDGFTYQSDNSTGKYDPDVGIWDIGNLNVDQSVSLKITVLVNPMGHYRNEATIYSYECDPDEANNSVVLQSMLGSAPNCGVLSPAILPGGHILVSGQDFVSNQAGYPLTVSIYNQWGGLVPGWPHTFEYPSTTYSWAACNYQEQNLEFSVTNNLGTCHQGQIRLNGSPGVFLTSAMQPDAELPAIDTGLLYVYCGNVPAPEEYIPGVVVPCSGGIGVRSGYSVPRVQPDWIMPIPCNEESDTAEIIFRTWESYDKDGRLYTLTDTIVVFRLPKLTPGAFVGEAEEVYECDLIVETRTVEPFKRFDSWKQPVGLHEYERPHTGLQGVTYEIPATIILVSLANAFKQGPTVYLEYLECEILRKANGDVVTIRDIISGDYANELVANANPSQLGSVFLQTLIGHNENPLVFVAEVEYEFYPYLLLQEGDWILSEDGNFEKVTADWFYNGNGNSPYWFAGGWPSIYGGEDCFSFCDGADIDELEVIKVRVPLLSVEAGGFSDICEIISLPEGMHCGITVERVDDSGWQGSCPRTRGVDSRITQTCWSRSPNTCLQEEGYLNCEQQLAFFNPEAGDLIVGYDCSDKEISIHLSQWQTVIDEIGPIFDFCFPYSSTYIEFRRILEEMADFNEISLVEETLFDLFDDGTDFTTDLINASISASVREGAFHFIPDFWELFNHTTYQVGSHDCVADVFIPDVQVIDNCSGVHSVKAMVEMQGGIRSVELVQNGVEHRIMENGDTCFVYTYSHLTNPIRIPFSGCDGEFMKVRYEAADNCWNQSTWYKYIKIVDYTPPIVITDRNINVSLEHKYAWVKAANIDEGSWDNCGIDLMLGRRTDWINCVSICENITESYTTWDAILADLGLQPGDTGPDFTFLRSLLSDDEVEDYFYDQIVWLYEDGSNCGEKVVRAWLFALAAYIGKNCSTADEHGNVPRLKDLEPLIDERFDQPGFGNELALLGGGWAKKVPVKCEDICEVVTGELLVLDNCCNWSTQWTNIHVENKYNTRLVKRLPDLVISCEAYNNFYKDFVDAAAAFGAGASGADSLGVFSALDGAFGSYIATWLDSRDRPIDTDGNLLPESDLSFNYWNVSCVQRSEEKKVGVYNHDSTTIDWVTEVTKTTYLDTAVITANNGIIGSNCGSNITQDVWVDLNDCGQGKIIRRFFISSGCGAPASSYEAEQVITIESACGMHESMFDIPANVGTKEAPICLPRLLSGGLSNSDLPASVGVLTVKDHLVGQLCNSIAIGSTIKELNEVGVEGMVKYEIEWTAIDWCADLTSTNREFTVTQQVIAVIDPSCDAITQTVGSGVNGTKVVVNRKVDHRGFILYQNYPNPYERYTIIGFNLPEQTTARLTIYDLTGRLIQRIEGDFNQGYNEVQLKASDLNASGVLYYQLDTERFTATKKMVLVRD